MIRHLIEVGLPRVLGEPAGPLPGVCDATDGLLVRLGGEALRALEACARLWNVDASAMASLILGEQVADFLARGRRRRDELRSLLGTAPAPPAPGPAEPGSPPAAE
jgi:hypothetical protein